MKSGLLPGVVVGQNAAVLELLTSEGQTLNLNSGPGLDIDSVLLELRAHDLLQLGSDTNNLVLVRTSLENGERLASHCCRRGGHARSEI